MRHLLACLLLGGCLIPEESTFSKLDDNYIAAPTTNDVEIYVDEAPPRRYRIVGTINVAEVDPEIRPIIAAKRARRYGCELVTTRLIGAVASSTPARPLFRYASWGSGGSSGGSRGSSGGSSGGSWWSGGSSSSSSSGSGTAYPQQPPPPIVPRSYYCGIYVEPPAPAQSPIAPEPAETIKSSLI